MVIIAYKDFLIFSQISFNMTQLCEILEVDGINQLQKGLMVVESLNAFKHPKVISSSHVSTGVMGRQLKV